MSKELEAKTMKGSISFKHNSEEFELIVNGQKIEMVEKFVITGGVQETTRATVTLVVPVIASGYENKPDKQTH